MPLPSEFVPNLDRVPKQVNKNLRVPLRLRCASERESGRHSIVAVKPVTTFAHRAAPLVGPYTNIC
jgi:hypothetical protein